MVGMGSVSDGIFEECNNPPKPLLTHPQVLRSSHILRERKAHAKRRSKKMVMDFKIFAKGKS